MKILVADDDGVTRKVLKAFLTQLKYDSLIVENGASALEVLRGPDAPAIAIIDWMMPDMEGLEVCRQLRSMEPQIDPYVFILTAKKDKTDVAAALDAGADDVISKPFNMVEMGARLRVAERSIQRQLKRGASSPASDSTVTAPVEAAPAPEVTVEPTLAGLTIKRTDELLGKTLADSGLRIIESNQDGLSGLTRSGGFTVWTGFVVTTEKVWLDAVLEVGEAGADALYTQIEGEEPADQGEVMAFLKKFHVSLVLALKAELRARSATILAPFGPVGTGATTLRLPEEYRRHRYTFRDGSFTLTLAVESCPLQLKRPDQLQAQEVLAESYPKLKKEEVTLLNQGAVLNARFIDKITTFDLSTEEHQPVPVFRPSAIALDFLTLGLLPAGSK